MKTLRAVVICFFLTGCLSGNRTAYDHWRWLNVDRERICYSINKKELLTSYYLESNERNKPNIILSSGRSSVNLSYPDTCINIKLKSGYQYEALFVLDDIHYRYDFFIDNNWNVVDLKGGL
ncbi:putative T6SS immunity periplasmic lipoprotein [Raoultella terrigena]|uniref:putative T6SS immunity periplasmic lipoprotein n=1 Tax=Raoultella terrigena TaxID=577 RepID=UPI001F343619|nr:hypothetical protein [Raoultella terrigena]